MHYTSVRNCRACNSKNKEIILNLGKVAYTGKFAKLAKTEIPKSPLKLFICKDCKFVQLAHKFQSNYLYDAEYGYESGVNSTMREHLSDITKKIIKLKKLDKNSIVLDIASNDGTLLNSYPKKIIKIGIDPVLKRFKKNYKNIQYSLPNFFSYKNFKKLNIKKKLDVITAFAVFYDLNNPNKFLQDIKKILNHDGIFVIEQSNLGKMLELNSFDTICQEHYGYYSTKVIMNLLKKNKLKIFNHEFNDSNGGSSRYFIKHSENKTIKESMGNIKKALDYEKHIKIDKLQTYKNFEKKILNIKNKCKNFFDRARKESSIVHGYGASTKGNVILQYFGITNSDIKYISERNSFKYNRFTPGTKIKIISEKNSRKKKPDYYFVLPWHFKKEILKREEKARKKGVKFIFPLPKFEMK